MRPTVLRTHPERAEDRLDRALLEAMDDLLQIRGMAGLQIAVSRAHKRLGARHYARLTAEGWIV